MSEYWKSNPRKFCDFCKCWIADNKPSVEFHERGKRHKENVQVRLAEMGKKGREELEAKQNEEDFLRQMETAALKAYKSDIEQNPDMTGSEISDIAASKNAKIVLTDKKKEKKKEEKEEKGPKVKKWHEAKSPEGYTYYWNTETNASSWEEPSEGFLSLAEQDRLSAKKKDSATISSAPVPFGPVKKAEAYTTWKQVPREAAPQVDLQLPHVPEEHYGPNVTLDDPEVTFAEKRVTLAEQRGAGEAVGFKRRKGGEHKKNMRRRTDDL